MQEPGVQEPGSGGAGGECAHAGGRWPGGRGVWRAGRCLRVTLTPDGAGTGRARSEEYLRGVVPQLRALCRGRDGPLAVSGS